jgi:hypothetical protein
VLCGTLNGQKHTAHQQMCYCTGASGAPGSAHKCFYGPGACFDCPPLPERFQGFHVELARVLWILVVRCRQTTCNIALRTAGQSTQHTPMWRFSAWSQATTAGGCCIRPYPVRSGRVLEVPFQLLHCLPHQGQQRLQGIPRSSRCVGRNNELNQQPGHACKAAGKDIPVSAKLLRTAQ